MRNGDSTSRRFDESLTERIQNGPEEARPHAKAWLGVVQVPNIVGVDAYATATYEIDEPPKFGVIPIVSLGLPFNLMVFGHSAVWEGNRATVRWHDGGEYVERASLLPDGQERVTHTLAHGALVAVFLAEPDAVDWARAKAGALHAAHRASVAAYRAAL
ncbi:hypothetical protein EBS80_02915 [bacterium]|nr:hypothetical protein [bacterium]